MAESLAGFNLVEHLGGHAFESPQGSFGYGRLISADRRPFRSSDGWLCVMPYSDADWRDFVTFAGRPDAAADARFASMNPRVDNAEEVFALVRGFIVEWTSAERLSFCGRASIPAAPVVDLERADDDPHQGGGLLRPAHRPTE